GAASTSGRRWKSRPLRRVESVRVGIGRADRRGVDLEWRHGVPSAAVEERRSDAPGDGGDRDHLLPRRLLPRREDARATELENIGAVTDRPRGISSPLGGLAHVLRRPGTDPRNPHPRCEHVVSGLPTTGGAAGERLVLPAAVREPRRPARLLEWDARAGRA